MVGPFSGDFLIHLNNLPATILLASAAVGFGTQLGLRSSLANLGGLALVCHTVVLKQLADAENDVAVTACFFASLLYVFRSVEGERRSDLVLGAVSLGLLAGIKYYALGYAALVGLTWLLLVTAFRGRQMVLATGFAGIVGGLVFGGYWYIRNARNNRMPAFPDGFVQPTRSSNLYLPRCDSHIIHRQR